VWRLAIKEAGLWYGKRCRENFRFHDLRHTAATRAHKKGHDITAVSKLLDHSHVSTTMRYIKTDVEDVRAVMD
jgi:integrase